MKIGAARDTVLDFWRGISVVGVILHHAVYFHYPIFRAFAETSATGLSFFLKFALYADKFLIAVSYRSGPLGVRVFFVLSGLIITTLMLREEEKSARMNIGKFYLRRIFRILPAFFVFLAIVTILGTTRLISFSWQDIWQSALFICNTSIATWNTVHTWTLAIEEQFYIIWPLLFVLIPRSFRATYTGILFAVLIAFSLTGVLQIGDAIDNAICFAHIALGALYALSPAVQKFLQAYAWRIFFGCVALAGVFAIFPATAEISHVLYRELQPLMILSAVIGTYQFMQLQNTRVFKWLASLGLISYSLYLWQELFLAPIGTNPLFDIAWLPILMFPIAIVSYRYIEKPAVAFAKKLQTRLKDIEPAL